MFYNIVLEYTQILLTISKLDIIQQLRNLFEVQMQYLLQIRYHILY